MLDGLAGAGAVEVDDMGPLGAGRLKLPGSIERGREVCADAVEPALAKANGAAAFSDFRVNWPINFSCLTRGEASGFHDAPRK